MTEAARTSETSVDNYFTRQYIPEDNSELYTHFGFVDALTWEESSARLARTQPEVFAVFDDFGRILGVHACKHIVPFMTPFQCILFYLEWPFWAFVAYVH
jgi:hypothetical protein